MELLYVTLMQPDTGTGSQHTSACAHFWRTKTGQTAVQMFHNHLPRTQLFCWCRTHYQFSTRSQSNILYIYFSTTVVKQWLCVKRCLISALVTFRSVGSLNERPIPSDLQVVASPADHNRWQKFEIIVRNVLQHPNIVYVYVRIITLHNQRFLP